MEETLKAGDYVIVQRQEYTKLQKLKERGNVNLGSLTVELDNVIGHRYYDLFQMKPKGNSKKLYCLEKASEIEAVDLSGVESGKDNRDITDDGTSQSLSKEEIENFRSELKSTEILEKLVSNSKTFELKTGYSQEKYIKKKERKYFDYVRVQRPSVRLLAQMFYRQDPVKILGLRIDDLSQILAYSGVQSEGDFVVYDSGTCGLVPAALLDRMGRGTSARLVHMHPGNEYQKNAVLAMQFPQELLQRCIDVNLYSVLRWYHQDGKITDEYEPEVTDDGKRKVANGELAPRKRPGWHFKNAEACEILRNKVDGVVLVAKEHPVSIAKELVDFMRPSRVLVAYNIMREPLLDLYSFLKERTDFVNVQLVSNFMRPYQVLPERTHPHVLVTSGGYILYAFKINDIAYKMDT